MPIRLLGGDLVSAESSHALLKEFGFSRFLVVQVAKLRKWLGMGS
jgi:hypothetical protein